MKSIFWISPFHVVVINQLELGSKVILISSGSMGSWLEKKFEIIQDPSSDSSLAANAHNFT